MQCNPIQSSSLAGKVEQKSAHITQLSTHIHTYADEYGRRNSHTFWFNSIKQMWHTFGFLLLFLSCSTFRVNVCVCVFPLDDFFVSFSAGCRITVSERTVNYIFIEANGNEFHKFPENNCFRLHETIVSTVFRFCRGDNYIFRWSLLFASIHMDSTK